MIDLEVSRLILAFICGYFLTLSGSLSQLVTNNSLASPSTLGMDGAAVLFVILSQFIGLGNQLMFSSESMSFILVIVSTLLGAGYFYFRKSKFPLGGGIDIQKLILFGLAFNLFVGAIFSIIQFLFMALNYEFPTGLWFGSLKQYEESSLYPFIGIFILLNLLLIKIVPKLNLLNLGSSFAKGIGIKVEKVQILSLLVSYFLNAMVIAYFGVFSFLGLIFPHILRHFTWFKTNMRRELWLGPYVCGFMFTVVDQFCYQNVMYGAELPVGMVSSVIGAFFLIFLVLNSKVPKA